MAESPLGLPITRRDGAPKVRGATRYAADVRLGGALFGAILRSPHAYARIIRIDTTAARQAAGVRAVLTGYDIPDRLAGRSLGDVPVLCRDVVRFIGDRVAAVAAESAAAAQRALDLIEVEYDELEPLLDVHAAIEPTAPVLHPNFMEYLGAPKQAHQLPNLCAYQCLTNGDPDRALLEVDRV